MQNSRTQIEIQLKENFPPSLLTIQFLFFYFNQNSMKRHELFNNEINSFKTFGKVNTGN